MAGLSLKNIRKSYASLDVLHGIDLEIKSGEFIVFVGPSGCGKSTLLRSIAGLEPITAGELRIDGALMNHVPPSKRGISMVFQSYALYPHMTVFENMAFGLRIAGMSKAEIERRVRRAADILQLTDYLARVPKALSGGQRQRVAIGRAIVRDPRVFLFDEPLSNLDAALRVATRIEIAKLKETMPDTTMIYVTHDQVEAMTLADRIVVFRDGRIEQVGAPMELYRKPANLFVARFIGSPAMNILPASITATGAATTVKLATGGVATLPMHSSSARQGADVSFGVRPEDLFLAENESAPLTFKGTVDYVEQLGEVQLAYIDLGFGGEPFIAKLPGDADVQKRGKITLAAAAKDVHIFDRDGKSLQGATS
ncbi:ABC transporter ATP-binding protein [Brucella sp. IR073]|uniref:ABC transporter ATP-binding protein n=1 Tax=unclassified Brucella TaxID=2632610 RepID=UPI003B9841CB